MNRKEDREKVKRKDNEKGEQEDTKVCTLTQLLLAVTTGVGVFWLALSQERERKKDVLKATNTWSRDYRYRTINVLVKLPIGVSVLGRVCSLCMSSDGEPRLWPGKSHNNGAWCFVSTFQRHSFFFLPGDKAQEMVSDMLVGTYGKEYTPYQWRSRRPGSGAGGWGRCGPLAWAVVVR